MRFLFYLGHPAHYHNFKHSVRLLTAKGHEVKVVARGKDVLFDLLEGEDWDLVRLPERKAAGGKLGLAANIAAREVTILRIARKFRPNLMAGTDLVITHVGRLLGIPSVIVNEDDSAAIPLMAKYAFPYATAILAPNCCDQSPANHKKIGYEGYHELAYLHPNLFSSSRDDLPEKLQHPEPYFLLRFASLHAHHDAGRRGISDELALKLIALLRPHGKVYITSERPFGESLEPYRLTVHPRDIHHVMAHAAMYIGDSQTMAAEAAVLGVPSIRYNDFVGELSYLEELEHKYGLTRGIRAGKEELLLTTVEEYLADIDLPTTRETARISQNTKLQHLLDNTIEVTPFWVECFEKLAAKNR